MKIVFIIAAVTLLSGCAVVDGMDSLSGLGNYSVDTNSFDDETIITLTPDTLYDPEASMFDPVSARIGGVWTSKAPNFINLAFQEDGGYVRFDKITFKADGLTKSYDIGLSDLNFDDTRLSGITSTAYAAVPVSELKQFIYADSCRMKIEKDAGYELADCKLDRIPGGKKTAIKGLKKMIKETEKIQGAI